MKKKIINVFIIGLLASGFIGVDFSFAFKLEQSNFAVEEYDLVIITPNEFSDELIQLLDHKNNLDPPMRTSMKTVEEIYNEFQGFDNPEKIKYFVKYAIENWDVRYVLLIGSIDKLPIRNSAVKCSYYTFEYVPTDHYYADIYDEVGNFSSWDTNGNNVYGEFNWDMTNNIKEYIDDVDLYPDIGVGRIPCSNGEDLKIVINKIINYETKTYGKDWFKKIILMGGDTHPQYEGYEGEMVTQYISEQLSDFQPVKLWTSLDKFKPLYINIEVSKGAGFISYSGHGLKNGISTNPPDIEKPIYYLDFYLNFLFNGNKLPIIFFDCCSTGTFDYALNKNLKSLDKRIYSLIPMFFERILDRILNRNSNGYDINVRASSKYKPCFAWSWLKTKNGGAIATLGASRMGYSGYVGDIMGAGTCRMNVNFFSAYEPGIILSDMLIKAQWDYLEFVWKDCFTIEEYNLFGDPSLKVGGYP